MTLPVVRLAIALFLVQAGFHGYTASLPLALAQADVGDATIGLIVGMAAVVQIPAAIVGGRLVDAFGGLRLFAAGGVAYLLASLILLLPGVEPGGSVIPFFAARALQGAGIAATLPAALSLVPRMLPKERTSSGIAFVGAAHNLTLVLLPPLSIAVLNASSIDGVAMMVIAFVSAGLVLSIRLPVRPMVRDTVSSLGVASRRFGITFRREWTMPLLIVVTYVAHWGAITAYLPIRAEQAGADIGLYFAADGSKRRRSVCARGTTASPRRIGGAAVAGWARTTATISAANRDGLGVRSRRSR